MVAPGLDLHITSSGPDWVLSIGPEPLPVHRKTIWCQYFPDVKVTLTFVSGVYTKTDGCSNRPILVIIRFEIDRPIQKSGEPPYSPNTFVIPLDPSVH